MAESDTILQLGIEAAREGNREEARNLFGLLTRQDPGNVQAWLWLAGVADGPDQRRAALERVVELDPTNEMAVKGLQAMGVKPTTKLADADASAPTIAAPVSSASVPPPPPAREMTDEERYAAELDSAFDDYDALPRTEVPARDPVGDADALDAAAVGERPRSTPRGTARERSAARRGSTPIRSDDDDDYDLRSANVRRSGPSPLLLGLLGLIVAVLACVVIYSFFLRGRGPQVAVNATNTAATAMAGGLNPTAPLPGDGTVPITSTADIGATPAITSTGTTTTTVPVASNGEPTAAPPAQPAGGNVPAAAANPNLQVVGIGEQLQANGWTYTYPNPNYVVVLGKQVGSFTANGNYVHVLAYVANNTGTDQPMPAGFFALKDAQGNVYPALPQASSAFVQRGVNADVGMEDAVPANGVLTSLYLVFDVPSGAQNLTLFAAGNNGQGWQVLNAVP
jgi:hypothetical protein